MLGRRQIREKILQAVYAYNQSGNSIDSIRERMFTAIEDVYGLYIYQLNLLIAVRDYAKIRAEQKIKRFSAAEVDTKFIDNPIFNLIKNNTERIAYVSKHKELTWSSDDNYPAYIYNKLQSSLNYINYFQQKDKSFEEDLKIVQKLFMKYVAESTVLHEWFEEIKLSWADDLHIANNMTIKTLKAIKPDKPFNSLIKVFKSDEDKYFARDLLNKVISNYPEFLEIIKARSKNWELDRIAEIDKIILSIGFCELKYFPSIPAKVVINECIELAKVFSTSKSNVFINGMLDKYAKEKGLT